jgi:hypothetical protein
LVYIWPGIQLAFTFSGASKISICLAHISVTGGKVKAIFFIALLSVGVTACAPAKFSNTDNLLSSKDSRTPSSVAPATLIPGTEWPDPQMSDPTVSYPPIIPTSSLSSCAFNFPLIAVTGEYPRGKCDNSRAALDSFLNSHSLACNPSDTYADVTADNYNLHENI